MSRDNKKNSILPEKSYGISETTAERDTKVFKANQTVSKKNQIKEIEPTSESNTGESKQNKEILVGEKSVKELVKLLETKLNSSNINNVKYCDQNFDFQRETLRYLKKKKNGNFK